MFAKGLQVGDVLTFIYDPSIKVTVAEYNKVIFENKLWHLSPLTREILKRKNMSNKSGAYDRPAYFTYQDKRLVDIENKY